MFNRNIYIYRDTNSPTICTLSGTSNPQKFPYTMKTWGAYRIVHAHKRIPVELVRKKKKTGFQLIYTHLTW